MNFKELKKILEETEVLLKRKNQMYGDGNIDSMGIEGVIFRITEKIERIKHLIKTDQNPEEEPLEDSWKDIIGFGIIGLMLKRNKWK
tara:strand:+ start:4773 stop:5033 length:261 start_codon:yes stop_codon:yes gene_type:complete